MNSNGKESGIFSSDMAEDQIREYQEDMSTMNNQMKELDAEENESDDDMEKIFMEMEESDKNHAKGKSLRDVLVQIQASINEVAREIKVVK